MNKQKYYLIVGLGKTGKSIAHYLQRCNEKFILFDTRAQISNIVEFTTAFPEAKIFLQILPQSIYQQLKAVIASPGISLQEPVLQSAFKQDIPVLGDIEFFAQKVIATPIIAITGTNGKSTVTSLVGAMAKAAGLSAAVAGNIGVPVLDLLNYTMHYDAWILELSSFQLELTYSMQPLIASILNITADHLDRHQNLTAYVQAKQHIYYNARHCLYNRDDILTFPRDTLPQNNISYGLDAPQEGHWGIVERKDMLYLAYGKDIFFAVANLRIKGRHNWQNALAACALSASLGVKFEHMVEVLQTFNGLPHRCQWIRTINHVDWINDSKGTNIGATCAAIDGIGSAISGKIVLIAGGQGKGANFNLLRQTVNKYVQSVVLIGEDAAIIQQALSATVKLLRAKSLHIAVKLAQQQAKPGDVVLLSPACASYDMFNDFNHRGEVFSELVQQL